VVIVIKQVSPEQSTGSGRIFYFLSAYDSFMCIFFLAPTKPLLDLEKVEERSVSRPQSWNRRSGRQALRRDHAPPSTLAPEMEGQRRDSFESWKSPGRGGGLPPLVFHFRRINLIIDFYPPKFSLVHFEAEKIWPEVFFPPYLHGRRGGRTPLSPAQKIPWRYAISLWG